MWYIYNGILLFSHKEMEIFPFATTWMKLEGIMLSEISQRNTNTWSHLYMKPKTKTHLYVNDVTYTWMISLIREWSHLQVNDLTYMWMMSLIREWSHLYVNDLWNLKQKQKRTTTATTPKQETKVIETENRLVVDRGRG